MIHRIFLLVISLTLLLSAQKICPDHYNPTWFEEASDELILVIDEYFTDQNITFLPTTKEMEHLGLQPLSAVVLQLPHAMRAYRDLRFPIHPGLWRYEHYGQGISTTHLLLKEPSRLSEITAINTYNDLLGAYWGDYAVTGYQMTLEPEDSRIRYKDRYFELNVKIYGLKNDATPLSYTYADLQFRDYSSQVHDFMRCKEAQ